MGLVSGVRVSGLMEGLFLMGRLIGLGLVIVLAIISEPEPQIEESSEYTVIANWFLTMGIESYRIRASGHYYQYQLKTILDKVKPRKV
jgi:hypothetical protein